MISFIPLDRFEVTGRGTALSGLCPVDTSAASDLVGLEMDVSGTPCVVVGVEWFALPRGPRAGEKIALIFNPVPAWRD